MTTMDREAGKDKPRISYDRVNRKVTDKDLRRVNLGKTFWMTTASQIQDENVRSVVVRYQGRMDEMVRTGSGILFTGGAGVGKTSAAACLLKAAIARGYTTYFVTHDELRELRFDKTGRLFGDGTDGVTVKQKIERAQVLVLDGFNYPFLTDKAFGPLELERLIHKRNSMMLTTVLTTRVAAELKHSQHEDLFEVVRSGMAPMEIRGRNLRDEARVELMQRVHGGGDE
jgi:DNA replication protein DnaC